MSAAGQMMASSSNEPTKCVSCGHYQFDHADVLIPGMPLDCTTCQTCIIRKERSMGGVR